MLVNSRHEGRRWACGFTLIEMLVVMLIVALLASGMVTVGSYVRQKAQVRSTEATIQLVTLALQEYQQHQEARGKVEVFPTEPYAQAEAVGGDPWGVDAFNACWPDVDPAYIIAGLKFDWRNEGGLSVDQKNDRIAARASSEVMYWYLSEVEASEKVLAQLPNESTTNDNGNSVKVRDGDTALMEVVDAWGRPLRYRTLGRGNFPSVDSAGPDGLFDTADDILSSEM